MADQPSQYASPPEAIALARETMRIKGAVAQRDAGGRFPPPAYADIDWAGMNLSAAGIDWVDMDMEQRDDLLVHVLDESIRALEPAAKWNERAIARNSPMNSSGRKSGSLSPSGVTMTGCGSWRIAA